MRCRGSDRGYDAGDPVPAGALDGIPDAFRRATPPALPELNEPGVVRHFTALSRLNYSVDGGFYPLGSCTMKHNPKVNEGAARLPGFAGLHPLAPDEIAQGTLQLLWEVQGQLAEISGMRAVTLQPAAGAQGELAGILMIRAYHRSRGDHQRDEVLVPDSSHGTNPATASMAGYKTVTIPSAPDGGVDLDLAEVGVDRGVQREVRREQILEVEPDARRVHTVTTPDVGGMAMFAGFLVAFVVAWSMGSFDELFTRNSEPVGVLVAAAMVLFFGALQVGLIREYQVNRLTSFLDPKNDPLRTGYNRQQAEIAIGSGGLVGLGYLKGTQTNLDFVPEQHTDFVFTVVGEEFGFVGAGVLVFLFGTLVLRAFRISLTAKDPFGTYVAAGVGTYFLLQVFVNIGMTLGIMPITGIPLPFVSYGGTALVVNSLAVGMLLSIHHRRTV